MNKISYLMGYMEKKAEKGDILFDTLRKLVKTDPGAKIKIKASPESLINNRAIYHLGEQGSRAEGLGIDKAVYGPHMSQEALATKGVPASNVLNTLENMLHKSSPDEISQWRNNLSKALNPESTRHSVLNKLKNKDVFLNQTDPADSKGLASILVQAKKALK